MLVRIVHCAYDSRLHEKLSSTLGLSEVKGSPIRTVVQDAINTPSGWTFSERAIHAVVLFRQNRQLSLPAAFWQIQR